MVDLNRLADLLMPGLRSQQMKLEQVNDYLAQIIETLRRNADKDNWLPIDTAPEGDSGFLVWLEDEQICWAVYKKDGVWFDHRNGMPIDDVETFSHWMPFPEGPKW